MDRNRVITPDAVERMIRRGHSIVISEGRVLKLDGWLEKHPGGRLAIMHMVGRDATNEINIYHSSRTLSSMHLYQIGTIVEPWVNLRPPVRAAVVRSLLEKEALVKSDTLGNDAPTDTASTTSYESSDEDAIRRKKEGSSDDLPVYHPWSHADYVDSLIQDHLDVDLRDYPSLDANTQQSINLKFQALHQRVKDDGYYHCDYTQYLKELCRYAALFAGFCLTLRAGWYLVSAVFLGFFWHQIMFTAHDAGHRGITHSMFTDTLIGVFIADFCCGLSIGWWKSSHNVHHLITNHPEHDPDIQNIPLFSTCPSFLKSIHSTYYDFTFAWDAFADFVVPYQKYTYYPVMGIARFNLYILSIHHLITHPRQQSRMTSWVRPVEIAFIACYWFWFGYLLLWCTIPTWPMRIAFVLTSHIITMPLHVQITLSHWGMSTADLGEAEAFAQRQLRTTMDIDCPAWLDWIHGGLQFQAVHHLFPQVPRHNLRRLQALVREFCDDTGIKYSILNFVDGNSHVLSRLGEVAAQVEIMVKCQKYMAETGESGLA